MNFKYSTCQKNNDVTFFLNNVISHCIRCGFTTVLLNVLILIPFFLCISRFVGPFLSFSPELCMVVEDETGIVGYACAALDARQFFAKLQVAWLPEMCQKYPVEIAENCTSPESSPIQVTNYDFFQFIVVF